MQNPKAIKILCVDDNPMIGEAVAAKLDHAGGFSILGQLLSADDLVQRAENQHPDIILLDIDMPGRDPFEAMMELREVVPEARVIMLTGHVRRDLIDRAFEAGAWGYLSKDNDVQELPDSIRRVAAGSIVLGRDADSAMQ